MAAASQRVLTSGVYPAAADRRTRRFLQAFFVTLGLLVFMWGTAYKLSLYAHRPPHQMPAKLSMRNGVAAAETLAQQAPVPPVPSAGLLLALLAAFPAALGILDVNSEMRARPARRSFAFADIPHQAFRPPPYALSH